MSTFSLIGQGFSFLLEAQTLMLLFVGVVIGLIAGSIPGLSSSNTTAILLPLTLGMTTHGALVFLAAIYVACQYGGSIPAILFKTPGTTGASATTLDGYPLARQGRATFALGVSLTASSIGGVISAAISLFIMKPSAQLALMFGPAEVFLLALVGIAVIVTASEKQIGKGLLAGALGLLIATMPADPTLGRPRLTFGVVELFDKIPLVPALVGLFAFPSLISLIGETAVANKEKSGSVGNLAQVMEGAIFTVKHWTNLLRSALIGLFVGICPGAGIDVASFLSYGQAKIWSKSPETFGKGNPEGVLAAEASNNAVCGGALVPSIALGIPGSATTAIMLAALTLHGINPGPQVMRMFPGEVFALFLTVLIANALLWPFGFVYTKLVSKLSLTNTAFLIPGIFSICLIGSFATRGFEIDMLLFIIFGLLGYVMSENNIPTVPLILGLVMGQIAEENFIVAFRLSKGSFGIFFSNTLAWILWVVIIAALVVPQVLSHMREKKQKAVAG
jgi:putative tricarboxylic transport membrane protein